MDANMDQATGRVDHSGPGSTQFASERDEMSLSEERAAQTADSVPDTLEVRDDSLAIMQGTVGQLRRPLLVAAVIVGAVMVLGIGVRILLKPRGDASPV